MLKPFGDTSRPAGDRRLVARVAERERAAAHVEQPRERGDEERFRVVAADFRVCEHEERTGIAAAAQVDALQSRLGERHEKARRKPLAGTAADHPAKPVIAPY